MYDFLVALPLGVVLKLVSGLSAAAFGLLGLERQASGALTLKSRRAGIGIIVATALGIASVLYDFQSGRQASERERSYKAQQSEIIKRTRALTEEAQYPFRDLVIDFKVDFSRGAPALAEYSSLVRKAFPPSYDCGKSADGCYGGAHEFDVISPSSPLFPKRTSTMGLLLANLTVTLLWGSADADLSQADVKLTPLGSFRVGLSEAKVDRQFLAVHPSSDSAIERMAYVVEGLHVPIDVSNRTNITSLAKVFPGFVASWVDVRGTAMCGEMTSARLSRSFFECISGDEPAIAGSLFTGSVSVRFNYPKKLLVDGKVCQDGAGGWHGVVLGLPEDIETLTASGAFNGFFPGVGSSRVCGLVTDDGQWAY